jgi:NADH-quinone oxidoreductase subunit J
MLGTLSSLGPPPIFPLADVVAEPVVIIFLCILAGFGTFLLLPNRQPGATRKLGGTVLALTAAIFAIVIIRGAAGHDTSGTGPFFWIFSAIALASAVRVITHPRPVYSALYFIITVFASAGLFVLMYAEFMAAALVLIYAGAILITYVFVIMLASSAQSGESRGPLEGLTECDLVSRSPFTACLLGFTVMALLLVVIFDKAQRALPQGAQTSTPIAAAEASGDQSWSAEAVHGSTQSLGQYLFQSQLVNLELAGLILTIAMVGAIVIARRRVVSTDDAFEPSSETITADMTPLSDDPRSIPVYGTTNPQQKAYPQN